jgi:hypothetical protein
MRIKTNLTKIGRPHANKNKLFAFLCKASPLEKSCLCQINQSSNSIISADKLNTYRFCDNVWTFMLKGVEFVEYAEIKKVDRVKIGKDYFPGFLFTLKRVICRAIEKISDASGTKNSRDFCALS